MRQIGEDFDMRDIVGDVAKDLRASGSSIVSAKCAVKILVPWGGEYLVKRIAVRLSPNVWVLYRKGRVTGVKRCAGLLTDDDIALYEAS